MLSLDALKRIPLFAGVGADSVEAIWDLGEETRHDAGELIFERGNQASDMMVVESGAAELFFPLSVLGVTKEVVVERVAPGDVLAWSALVGPYARTLSGRCSESCLVRRFARDRLKALFEERPSVGYAIMESLAAVVARRLDHFQNLWIREVQAKIVRSLG